MALPLDRVSVKASTNNGLGSIGRVEGVAAHGGRAARGGRARDIGDAGA